MNIRVSSFLVETILVDAALLGIYLQREAANETNQHI